MSPKWAERLRKNKATFPYARCGLEYNHTRFVKTTTTDELIAQHGVPYFVKIDVEGHELSVLRGLHRPVSYLSFEINLQEFRPKGFECTRELTGLVPTGLFSCTTDCAHGLALKDWAPADDFCVVFDRCEERSIEIFWKTEFSWQAFRAKRSS